MTIFLNFLHLMEALVLWSSLQGFTFFLFLISKGSGCELRSIPECYRQYSDKTNYFCEWSFNTNASDARFDFYYKPADVFMQSGLNLSSTGSTTKFGETKENPYNFLEEELLVGSKIDIWMEAHTSNSNCVSPRWSGVLMDRVKYMAPQHIQISWERNSLDLRWKAPEEHPALAEVCIQPKDGPTESSETRLINTTYEEENYKLLVTNLQKNTAYSVGIRHRSTKAKDPLWSNWSTQIVVPAALEHKPDITETVTLENGYRKVKLTWKPMPSAAAVGGVKYIIKDTQSSHNCPCKQKKKQTSEKEGIHTVYVSYSSVNITVVAKNLAGQSPQAVIKLPVASAANLTICNTTLLDRIFKLHATCVELYELQEENLEPKYVVNFTAQIRKEKKKEILRNMSDYIRYLYFEHRCVNGKPQTVQMCFFYKKEGVPNKEPQDFIVSHETQNSAQMFWKPVPYEHQRGFLTHYSLCIVKINSQNEECFNISSTQTSYRLKNLTPGTKYDVSLAGATRMGKGHKATAFFTTLSEGPVNVWWSFGLLIGFFLFSTMCTIVLKRIRNTIFPPVPTPVIPDFPARQPDSEKWEGKEEVHKVTLYQLLQEGTSIPEEATVFREEWDGGTEVESEGSHADGSSDECESSNSTSHALRKSETTDIEQMDAELALLIYRNGLVFDVKGESR